MICVKLHKSLITSVLKVIKFVKHLNNMGKAIGLIRVSTKSQKLESQSQKVKEAMIHDGYSEKDIILIEDKESGSKLSEEERSGLNKLKYDIEHEDVDVVYTYEISRISRRPAVIYSIREYLVSKGIQLVILNPYCKLLKDDKTIDEGANMVFAIFGAMSETETQLRNVRVMRGKEKKRSEGKLSCGKPIFGYTIDKDKFIIPHPVHSKTVQEIYERYANRESSGSIGKDLWLRNGLTTKSQKLISYQTFVCTILREKRYAKIDQNSIYPALITKELFYKVQEIHESKPEYFVRKSRTKYVYPLQGYIYTEDKHVLIPSITNNRYLKMRGSGTDTPLSLNMKAVHGLATIIINQYLESGVLDIDREKQRNELNTILSNNIAKLAGIDGKIKSIEDENDRINTRIIKGRMSEKKGDEMIDNNMRDIYTLEDTRVTLQYENMQITNKLAYLANPFMQENEVVQATNDEELKELVNKYLLRVDVEKIGHSRYILTFKFKDGIKMAGEFYSNCRGITYDVKKNADRSTIDKV